LRFEVKGRAMTFEMPFEMRGEATVHIDSSPDAIYDLVSDITRMGEWSPECQGADWVDDANGAVVGAQFHGRNKRSENEWVTPNTVLVAERGREFAWVVGTEDFQVCRWRFRFEERNGGTDVTESFELGTEQVGFAAAVLEHPEDERPTLIEARRTQLVEDIRQTLDRLKECAEGA
jgi:ribosome-associated toxin RatA of RatAB toxin-antitoxin module